MLFSCILSYMHVSLSFFSVHGTFVVLFFNGSFVVVFSFIFVQWGKKKWSLEQTHVFFVLFLNFCYFLFWLIIVIVIINLHSFLRAALFHSTLPLQRKRRNHLDSVSFSQFPLFYLFVIWFNNFSWFKSIFVSFNYGSHHPNSVFLSNFVSVFYNLGTFCVTQAVKSVVYMFCCWERFNYREGAMIHREGLEGCKRNTKQWTISMIMQNPSFRFVMLLLYYYYYYYLSFFSAILLLYCGFLLHHFCLERLWWNTFFSNTIIDIGCDMCNVLEKMIIFFL